MDRPAALVRNYLTPPSDSFWCWTDDGEALVWTDGQPIASREEVRVVLARLAPRGLPPFGAVVLMLAACDGSWRDRSHAPGALAGYVKYLQERQAGGPKADMARPVVQLVSERVHQTLRALDAVGSLSADLRTKSETKAVIAEILFETTKELTTPEAAAQIVAEVSLGLPGAALVQELGALDIYQTFLRDIEALKAGLAEFSEDRLRVRQATGLDRFPRPAELDLPPAERVRRLIFTLVADRELAGLGRLAQRLVAAVHVPRRLSAPEELPLGGVSDLSNRGPLERLLVSELAHDDLTLAVRVALNEALYLRRESPPRTPPERRCLLLDAGIRLWGVPRVFAAAVALALAATTDRRAAIEAHRARKAGVTPVDLLSRDGLSGHLEALETAPHPGASLAGWLEALQKKSTPETISDLVVVTHEDALADAAFLAHVAAIKADLYVATVNRDGQFRLQLLSAAGRRPICAAKLSLDEVLEPPPAPFASRHVPLESPGASTRLPLVLSMQPFPLRMPAHVSTDRGAAGPDGLGVAVTKDGRLLTWKGDAFGGRELTARVPSGKIVDVSLIGRTVAEALVRRSSDLVVLVRADLITGTVTTCELAGPVAKLVHVRRQSDTLLLICRDGVRAFDPGTGERAGSLDQLPRGATWMSGRFFRVAGAWYAVAYDGHEVSLRHVSNVAPDTVALFDREGLDGPWGITNTARVYSTSGPSATVLLASDFRWVGVRQTSRDGHRLLIVESGKEPRHLIDLEKGETRKVFGDAAYGLEPALSSALRDVARYNVRRKVAAIAVGADGALILKTSDGVLRAVELGGDGALKLAALPTDVRLQLGPVPFVHVTGPDRTRVPLHEAAFSDGSCAFLDARGIVHLKSADRSLPELALVLNEPALAVWSTAGQASGAAYYLGDLPRVPASTVMADIERFVRRLR